MECGRSLLARIWSFLANWVTTPPQRWKHVARLVRGNRQHDSQILCSTDLRSTTSRPTLSRPQHPARTSRRPSVRPSLLLDIGIGLDAGVFSAINLTAFRPRIDDDPEFCRFLSGLCAVRRPAQCTARTPPDSRHCSRSTRTLRRSHSVASFACLGQPGRQPSERALRWSLATPPSTLRRTSPASLLGRLLTPESIAARRVR